MKAEVVKSDRERALHADSARKEFWWRIAPIVAGLVVTGYAAAWVQHGFVPGSERAFPLAGVAVPNWHLFWMGLWTGYTMALVGQAAGIFALTYSMSILQFTSAAVTPTTMVITFLNPIGALLGFRQSGQWIPRFARWVCIGGAVGGVIGPFLRVSIFSEPKPFQFLVGLVLAFVGFQLLHDARRPASREAPYQGAARIEIQPSAPGRIAISCQGRTWDLSDAGLFWAGASVGVISAALGLGGGFLLVPLFASVYGLPMFVLAAATIPYVVVLSAVGLITYSILLPLVGQVAVHPEWSWGLIAAAGGVLGAWLASKAQRFVPDHLLKLMLGMVTAGIGCLYVANFFLVLPFKL